MKYVCDVCGWIYDEAVGDASLGIESGRFFVPFMFSGKRFFQ